MILSLINHLHHLTTIAPQIFMRYFLLHALFLGVLCLITVYKTRHIVLVLAQLFTSGIGLLTLTKQTIIFLVYEKVKKKKHCLFWRKTWISVFITNKFDQISLKSNILFIENFISSTKIWPYFSMFVLSTLLFGYIKEVCDMLSTLNDYSHEYLNFNFNKKCLLCIRILFKLSSDRIFFPSNNYKYCFFFCFFNHLKREYLVSDNIAFWHYRHA